MTDTFDTIVRKRGQIEGKFQKGKFLKKTKSTGLTNMESVSVAAEIATNNWYE